MRFEDTHEGIAARQASLCRPLLSLLSRSGLQPQEFQKNNVANFATKMVMKKAQGPALCESWAWLLPFRGLSPLLRRGSNLRPRLWEWLCQAHLPPPSHLGFGPMDSRGLWDFRTGRVLGVLEVPHHPRPRLTPGITHPYLGTHRSEPHRKSTPVNPESVRCWGLDFWWLQESLAMPLSS